MAMTPTITHKENPRDPGMLIDMDDPSVYWDGSKWVKNGKSHKPKKGSRLIGMNGSPYQGWYYDWSQRWWVEPGKQVPDPPAPSAMVPANMMAQQPMQVQRTGFLGMGLGNGNGPGLMDSLKSMSLWEVVGVASLFAAELPEPPDPPLFDDSMTDAQRSTATALYNQNQQSFERRMSKYRTIGFGLLGATTASHVVSMLNTAKT